MSVEKRIVARRLRTDCRETVKNLMVSDGVQLCLIILECQLCLIVLKCENLGKFGNCRFWDLGGSGRVFSLYISRKDYPESSLELFCFISDSSLFDFTLG